MFKVYKNLSPTIEAVIFGTPQNNYNLRHFSFFSLPYANTVYHGSESLSNLGPRIWNLVPSTLKKLDDFRFLRHKLKNGNLKTVRLCSIKLLYLVLDSYSFFCFFNHFVQPNHFILFYYL